MSKELIHRSGDGPVLAEKSTSVEYVGVAQPVDRQTTVYTFTGTPEPPPVVPAPNPRHSSKESGFRTPPDVVERARRVLGCFDLDPFSSAAANELVKAREFFSGIDGGLTCVRDHAHGPGQTCHGPLDAVDGFEEHWRGRVFCNPPGGRGAKNESNQKRAWFKLAAEYLRHSPVPACRECGYALAQDDHEAGCSRPDSWIPVSDVGVSCALFVCFSVELLQTTQVKTPRGLPLPLDFPICFPSRRVAYLTPDGAKSKSPPHSSCLVLLPDRARRTEMVSAFMREFSPLGRVVVPATWGVVEGGGMGP